ncbi:hypothetical protein P7K49_003221, partial [Saguinus oedipus]
YQLVPVLIPDGLTTRPFPGTVWDSAPTPFHRISPVTGRPVALLLKSQPLTQADAETHRVLAVVQGTPPAHVALWGQARLKRPRHLEPRPQEESSQLKCPRHLEPRPQEESSQLKCPRDLEPRPQEESSQLKRPRHLEPRPQDESLVLKTRSCGPQSEAI